MLRTYTLGDRPIAMEFLSEQLTNFHDALNGTVNYEDPNLNIAYPVFSIHGNHDDPSGNVIRFYLILFVYGFSRMIYAIFNRF